MELVWKKKKKKVFISDPWALQWISRNLKANLLVGTYMCMIRFVNV